MPQHDEWDGVSISVEVTSDNYCGFAELKRCWLGESGEVRGYQIRIKGKLLTVPLGTVFPRVLKSKKRLGLVK